MRQDHSFSIIPPATKASNVSAAILGGGAATRLSGAVKPLLEVGGVSILERLCATLAPRFDDLLLVVKELEPYARAAAQNPPWRMVCDKLPSRSSLTGLHAAIAAARYEHVFVTAGDSPFLRPELIDALLALLRPEDDVLLPRTPDGYIEPLCAIYSRRCLPRIEARLARGEHKIGDFLSTVHLHPLPLETLLRADPEQISFRNANTPEELRALREIARGTRQPGQEAT